MDINADNSVVVVDPPPKNPSQDEGYGCGCLILAFCIGIAFANGTLDDFALGFVFLLGLVGLVHLIRTIFGR